MSSPHLELDAFLTNNSDLLRLEGMLSRFNLFEAMGVVRQELRHSDFLVFLIDPNQSHSLKSTFLRELLLATNVTQSVTFAGFDLTQATVFREWHHTDILVVDDVNRLAVTIENKIGTGEHSDQLNRFFVTNCLVWHRLSVKRSGFGCFQVTRCNVSQGIISLRSIVMEKTISMDTTPRSDTEYQSLIDQHLSNMVLLQLRMTEDQREIETLRAETDAILTNVMQMLKAA